MSDPQQNNSTPIRVVVKDGGVRLVSESGELVELRHYQRSETFTYMAATESGTSELPISHSGIELWQEAVDSLLRAEIWHLHRALQLSVVAQVAEYLYDQEVLDWAIRHLAQAVDKAVRAKYTAQYSSARNNADAAFWRQMLRPRDITTGVRFSRIADAERRVTRSHSPDDPRMTDADHHLLSSCQALINLPQTLQTKVLILVPLPLCALVPQLPDDLLGALLRRHLTHGSLDLSNQLKIHEFERDRSRGLRELVKKLPFKVLAPELRSLRPLRSLNVSDNSLVLADATPLATFLECCSSELQTLALSKNSQQQFAAAVLPSLKACVSLTCLDLSGCTLRQSSEPLGAVLRAVSHSLQRLVLNNCNGLSLEDLAQPLSGLTALTSLSLRENLMMSGFTVLTRVLRGLRDLQELDLSSTAPHCDSLACAVASAVQLPDLHTLRLEHMSVSMDGGARGESTGFIGALSDPSSTLQGWIDLYSIEVVANDDVRAGGSAQQSNVPSVSRDAAVQMHGPHASAEGEESDFSAPPDFKSVQFKSLRELHLSHMHGISIDWLMAIATAQLAWKSNRLRDVGRNWMPWRAAVRPPSWEVVRAHDAPEVSPLQSPWSLVAMLPNLEVLDIGSPEYSFRYPSAGGAPNWSCKFIFQLPNLKDLRARNLNAKHGSFELGELSDGLSSRLEAKEICGLTALDWSMNSCTIGDIRRVCSISTLQRLVLQSCGVGIEGATVLAEHVSQLSVLHTLDMAGNELTGGGVSALLHGVVELESLRVVDVGGGGGAVQAVSELKAEGIVGSGVDVSCTLSLDPSR